MRSELCAIALAICGASPALAETTIGQASIIDDDTLEIRGQRIRLSGIEPLDHLNLCGR